MLRQTSGVLRILDTSFDESIQEITYSFKIKSDQQQIILTSFQSTFRATASKLKLPVGQLITNILNNQLLSIVG